MWKCVSDRPQNDVNYLVCWREVGGDYSAPHRAYFDEEEGKFFSLENNNGHPIIADIYFAIPKTEDEEDGADE